MTTVNDTRPQIPLKDFYSVSDAAALLGIGVNTVRAYARAKDNPMPFRRLNGFSRGMFITRHDLSEWVYDNSSLVAGMRRKESTDEGE